MNLDDAQKRTVADWIALGQKLSEIQKRLGDELHIHLTYMEVRMLVDDLKLMPKDAERVKQVELSGKSANPGSTASIPETRRGVASGAAPGQDELLAPGAVNVSVKVDQLARPDALVSGSVTFSDGHSATWYLDQMGRLGLAPKQQGYKPSPPDIEAFQAALQNELAKMGF